jgi:hypothetical protein
LFAAAPLVPHGAAETLAVRRRCADFGMDIAALALSLVAIAFSAFTFWWLNWRPGKLHLNIPTTYAGYGGSDKLLLEFPFVFYNGGGTPVVVDDLRIRLPQEPGIPLAFNATVDKIGTDEGRVFSTPFWIGPRQAVGLICEFQRAPGDLSFELRDYKLILEGRLNGSRSWKRLLTFSLRITERALSTLENSLLVHVNPI